MSDRDSAQPGFDPRFDPAFQPGYDPLLHRPKSVFVRRAADRVTGSQGAIPRTAESPDTDTQYDSAGDDALRGHAAGLGGADSNVAGAEHQLAEDAFPTETESSIQDPPPWWRRANPYLLALGVLGVVFIAAGFFIANAGIESMRNGFDGGPGQDAFVAQMFAQIGLFGTPMLIALGLATLTSAVVILAVRWTPSKR